MNEHLHLICHHCHTLNRFPTSLLGNHPKCGKCRRPIHEPHPIDLNSSTFFKYISKTELPVLVDFWASWCGPCKMMAPAFAQAAGLLHPGFRLAKVNTEIEQHLAQRFNVMSVPTMALFKNGHEIARTAGALDANSIANWARQNNR